MAARPVPTIGAKGRHVTPAPLRRRDPPAWIAWPAVIVLTGLSLGLGFYHLSARSLWLDEGYTWITASQSTKGITAIAGSQGYHLLPYYMLIHAVIGRFGDSAFVMRAPSVIAGALCVPLIYLLGRRLGSRVVGLYAALLFVISEPMVFWQQNARDYAFVVLISVASTLAAVVGLQKESIWSLVAWAVILAIGCYTHPEMLLLVVPQELVLFVWSRSARVRGTVVVLTVVGGLASLPALLDAVHSSVYETTPLLPPGVNSATEIATFLASGAGTGVPVTAIDHALLGVTFLLVVVGVAMLGSDLVERGCSRSNLGLGLGLAWLILPPVASWLVSESGHPDFLDRYLILSLPAAALVLALVPDGLGPRSLGLFGLVYLTIFRFGVLAPSYDVPLDDFSTATAHVLTSARPGDCVTVFSNQARVLYDYYSGRMMAAGKGHLYAPIQVLPYTFNGTPYVVLQFNDIPPATISAFQTPEYVTQAAKPCSRIWLFQSHAGSPTGSPTSRLFYSNLLTLEHNLQAWYHPAGVDSYHGVTVSLFNRFRVPAK